MPPHSRPAVMFRSGARMQAGKFAARHWSTFAADCWAWATRAPDRFDIVAFSYPADELVEIEHLGDAG